MTDDKEAVMQKVHEEAMVTVEWCKNHGINYYAIYDTGENSFRTVYTLDHGSATEFSMKLILMLDDDHQDKVMKMLHRRLREQRGIPEPAPKKKVSILWGLVSFG
jgi:hypothetical protein